MSDKSYLIDNVALGDTVLSMQHITKIYSNGFVANKDVSLDVKKGEIVGLVGENGAGKTTLMKVLFGQEPCEQGTIILGGEPVVMKDPLDALSYGIGMVHQHFMLVETLTVAENMILGAEPGKGFMLDLDKAKKMTKEVSDKYELPIDPDMLVKDLSVGLKQRVEILKMLLRGAKIILLDEPTAVLTPQETAELFNQLKKLKSQGFSFVFISHKLNEVKQICDRITVMRLGKVSGTANIEDVTEQDISRMMVGRDVILDIEKAPAKPGETVLKVNDLSFINKFGLYAFDGLNFSVRRGEILGVAGVEGNGQNELADNITGLEAIQSGDITVNSRSIKGLSIGKIRDLGVAMVHEDRMKFGSSVDQLISENLISTRLNDRKYKKGALLDAGFIKTRCEELIDQFKIKCESQFMKIRTLSGGNVQKVVAAREFSNEPDLLVVCHPTRVIDVGSSEMIRNKMVELRDNGSAVLLFTADLNEILTVSDSIIVMHKGKINAYFKDAKSLDENTLGEYMLGIKNMTEDEIKEVCHE